MRALELRFACGLGSCSCCLLHLCLGRVDNLRCLGLGLLHMCLSRVGHPSHLCLGLCLCSGGGYSRFIPGSIHLNRGILLCSYCRYPDGFNFVAGAGNIFPSF